MRTYNILSNNMQNNLKYSAYSKIRGNTSYPDLYGTAAFFETPMGGLLIQVEVFGLPEENLPSDSGFFGMHIHEYGDCTPPFDQTGNHYDPFNRMHPDHAGDLPPLLSNNGYAWTVFYDERLSATDIVGKSLIIHSRRDDFTSQPSGDSGEKIGCGIIMAV